MKILTKTLVAAGVATAVLATGAAQAATISNPSTALAPAAGKTIVNEGVRTTVSLVPTVVTMGAGESLAIDDSIKFTLSSGVWKAIVTGDISDADSGGSAGPGVFALVAGGVGKSSATYRVTTATTAAHVITLAATATVTGTAIADNALVTVTTDMNGFVGGSSQALFGSPLVALNTQLAPAMTATFAAATGTHSVATGFSTLVGATVGTGLTVGQTTSATATVTPVANANAATAKTTTGVPTAVPTPAKTLITISGPMAGVTSISAPNIDGTSPLGVVPTPASANLFVIDAASNSATGVTTTTAATPIQITFAGTQAYAASAYTAVVSLLTDGVNYIANNSVGAGALYAFGRDGSAFTTNSFGSLNKMTVTDRSGGLGGTGADGAITITAFDAAGAAVTCTGLAVANIPNNGTTTIQGADVMTACPGAKRIEGVVNSTSILATNTKIASDGATSQAGITAGATVAN